MQPGPATRARGGSGAGEAGGGTGHTTYQGFNQQHLTEMLAERAGRFLSRPPVYRLLRTDGAPAPRRRRLARAHHRRDRLAKEGCLLQVDGSRHDWLERSGPLLTLVGGIDDATGQVGGATFQSRRTPGVLSGAAPGGGEAGGAAGLVLGPGTRSP